MARKKRVEIEKEIDEYIEQLALNGELPLTFFVTAFSQAKTTARRRLNSIQNMRFGDYKEKMTSQKGKPQYIYKLTLRGIVYYLLKVNFVNIERILKHYHNELLTFKYWKYFENKKVKNAVLNRMKTTFKELVCQEKQYTNEEVDIKILISGHILFPTNNIKERVTEEEFEELVNIWYALDNNYELAEFRDLHLYQEKLRISRELKSIQEWSNIFAKHHSSAQEFKAGFFVVPERLRNK